MNIGFYPRLAWNNIQKNTQVYIPYIVTSTGIVAMFYVVCSLAFDPEVNSFPFGGGLAAILALGIIVIGLFSLIFLFYTNSFLMKRRKTELGLYNVLGMGKRHIAKVLLWETLDIAFFSLVLGLSSGMLLSKIGQLGLLRLLNMEVNYTFRLSPIAVMYTVILFSAIFFLIYLNSLRQIVKSSARELLSSNAAGEKEPRANILLAIAGVVILGGGYVLAMMINNPYEAIGMFFIAVLLVILGTYLCFIAGSVALCKLLRKNKKYYYKTRHFISVSSMIYRMKRNGAGLASICILSTMVLVMLSSTTCMYIGGEDSVARANPREISVSMTVWDTNRATFDAAASVAKEIADKEAANLGMHINRPVSLRCYTDISTLKAGNRLVMGENSNTGPHINLNILPAADYNAAMSASGQKGKSLHVGQALLFDGQDQIEGDSLIVGNGRQYKIVGRLADFPCGQNQLMGYSDIYLVVPTMEDVYRIYHDNEAIRQAQEGSYPCSMWYWYGFDSGVGEEINNAFVDAMLQSFEDKGLQQSRMEEKIDGGEILYARLSLHAATVDSARENFFGLYGGMFFLGILLSITFLMATVMIMYYKQITEGYEDQSRYEILQKVGMTEGEIRQTINSQVLTVFFAPLLLAGVHILFAFHMISLMLMLFSIANTGLLIKMTGITYLLFAIFYIVVYLFTAKAYYRLVSGRQH